MRIGIYGYGNLGRGVECAITKNPDMTLSAVFTRRDPAALHIATAGVPVVAAADIEQWKDKVDVLILCGGSATDLPKMTPAPCRRRTRSGFAPLCDGETFRRSRIENFRGHGEQGFGDFLPNRGHPSERHRDAARHLRDCRSRRSPLRDAADEGARRDGNRAGFVCLL